MEMNGVAAFQSIASAYDQWFTTPLGQYVAEQETRQLRQLLNRLHPETALDIGAGTGFATRILLDAGWDVTAVEPSEAMQAIGRQKLPAVRWITAGAENLPFPDEAFACVLFFTTLEFVDNPRQAIGEALRVLQPGGHLIIGFLEVESSWVAVYRHRADRGELPWRVARFYDQQQLETMVGQPAQEKRSALWLAPYAHPPYDEADRAGQRAGNVPGFSLIMWEKH